MPFWQKSYEVIEHQEETKPEKLMEIISAHDIL